MSMHTKGKHSVCAVSGGGVLGVGDGAKEKHLGRVPAPVPRPLLTAQIHLTVATHSRQPNQIMVL